MMHDIDFYYCKKCRVHLAANLVVRDEETSASLCPNCETQVTAHSQQASGRGRTYEKRQGTPRFVNFPYYAPDGRQKETAQASSRIKEDLR